MTAITKVNLFVMIKSKILQTYTTRNVLRPVRRSCLSRFQCCQCTGRSGKLHLDLTTLSDRPRVKLPLDTPLAFDSAGLLPGLVFLLPDDDADEADDALPPDVADDSA